MMISSSSCIVKKIGKGKRIYRLFMLFPWFFRCKGKENKLVPMDLGILKKIIAMFYVSWIDCDINVTIIMYWFNVNPFRKGFQSFSKKTLVLSEGNSLFLRTKFAALKSMRGAVAEDMLHPSSKIYFIRCWRYTSFAVEVLLAVFCLFLILLDTILIDKLIQ